MGEWRRKETVEEKMKSEEKGWKRGKVTNGRRVKGVGRRRENLQIAQADRDGKPR